MPDRSPDRKKFQTPITLYVESVDFKPTVDIMAERVTVVDLEISEINAKEIIRELRTRLRREHISSIRIRFSGRLVL